MSQRNSGYQRTANDLYITPDWVTLALIDHLNLPKHEPIWEPSAGTGAIVQALQTAGYINVKATDISGGFDFLKDQSTWLVKNILTNPPFTRAAAFIERGLKLITPGGLLALLLRIDFDSAVTRRHLFSQCPMWAEKLILTRRPKWFDGPGTKSPSDNFAWFIWRHDHHGPPSISYSFTQKETNMIAKKPKLETVEVEQLTAPTEPAAAAPPAPDPFDLANLRLSQNFNETAGVKKLLRTVPIRKPNRQDFVRIHPDPAYRENFAMVELKEDREEFLVAGGGLIGELAAEITNKTIFTAINRQGVVFLWPVRLPNADGKEMEWHRSARDAAEEATKRWVRVSANMSLGAYELIVADGITIEPEWPDVSFQELIRIAFRERLVTSLDHPVVKRLRGLT